jgi:hypothetical protein
MIVSTLVEGEERIEVKGYPIGQIKISLLVDKTIDNFENFGALYG